MGRTERLISLLLESNRIMREQMRREKGHLDPFTMIRLDILRFIAAESPTMRGVAEYLHVTAPSATSMVGRLVRSGFAVRKEPAGDRRVVRLRITQRGKNVLAKGMERVVADSKRILSGFSQKDIDSLVDIFGRFVESEKKKQISK